MLKTNAAGSLSHGAVKVLDLTKRKTAELIYFGTHRTTTAVGAVEIDHLVPLASKAFDVRPPD
jgi:uncharacterized hydantoinase/oxoprolinase family protein